MTRRREMMIQSASGDIPVKFHRTIETSGLYTKVTIPNSIPKYAIVKLEYKSYTYSAVPSADLIGGMGYECLKLYRSGFSMTYSRLGSKIEPSSLAKNQLIDYKYTNGPGGYTASMSFLGKIEGTWDFYVSEFTVLDTDENVLIHIKADISGHWKDMLTGELLPNYRDGEITEETFPYEVIEE